jgi:DNA invertase Pin-like site-specific DNA recombinase
MKTAVLYIRVSTDEQAEKGFSQRHQEECCVNIVS